MPIGIDLENNAAAKPKDSFDEYLERISQPKPNYQPDEPLSSEEEPETESTYLDDSEIHTIKNNIEFSLIPAETIVDCIDMGFVGINSIIAKKEQMGASESEKEGMKKAWANYLKDKNADLSPGWMLLIMILMVYAPKSYSAWQVRKLEEKTIILQTENDEKERQIQELQVELLRMRKAMDEQQKKEA